MRRGPPLPVRTGGGTRMNASSGTARTLVLVAGVLLVGCKREAGTGPGQPLQPLPAPPAITIAPDAVPTAGLTVVAARPHAVVGADARPTITFSRPVVALGSVE